MSATNSSAAVARSQAKRHRSALDSLKRVLPERSAKLTAGLTIVIAMVLFAIIVPIFTKDPNKINDIGLSAPSAQHWLGTTQSGQDVFTQLGYSVRGSLIIGFAVGLIATAMSFIFGVLGTYIGGIWDDLFSLITNIMLVIPGLPLTIVISALMPSKGTMMLVIVISITAWAGGARVLRAQTLSMRGRDYVLAAKIAGERPWRVITVEILPNLLPVMGSQFVFSVIMAILSESSLSFIGLGSTQSFSLGTMLYYAQNGSALNTGAWWWFLPPGLCIALLGTATLHRVDPDRLENTVNRVNRFAVTGVDEDFGRGSAPYDRYYGDQSVQPNPNLAPIDEAPFYALKVYPGDIGTKGGLATDETARVLDTAGQPIPGLYAIGNNAASVMGPSYPGAGSTLAPAMTFGYLAILDCLGDPGAA